ncbi:ATP-dependent helicase [Pelagerythrobacter aerophilus]|uniref:DNA 3'-5' helicase n=1 Tax=Pelagerythrobacter aerophilus TaxID=2306995 RepID=A0A418NL28_9SPHN|nr:ATP-dependent helicase [Pelagerythrobacter aerophilus]RIV80355.1 ImmA/IrrE family metallo-endopeptidase [Pelagerythrobacter aerophilus]
MELFAAARALALEKRQAAVEDCDEIGSTAQLLEAAARGAKLNLCAVDKDDGCLRGAEAVLDRDLDTIFYKSSTPLPHAHFQIAHELGHFWLDGEASDCDASSFNHAAGDLANLGAARVDSYSPKERREAQANVFAREMLLPAEIAANSFVEQDRSPNELAVALEVPLALVFAQLIRGTLLPSPEPSIETRDDRPQPSLDDSQKEAAEVPEGPLLLEAGPGTGKTRTLVARVEHLLAKGVAASNMLVLTYSNKAAEELRERVQRVATEAATQMWSGTFHAFGLELLRKYGHLIGLPAAPKLADLNESIALLETLLPELPLDHYLVLHQPSEGLLHILKAISRAKDELVGPKRYREICEAMPSSTEDDVRARERALEVAEIYAAYEQALRETGRIDFGDLIMRSVELLDAHPEIAAELIDERPHILVDEFQDVNRASSVLLERIAGDAKGLWVVGDSRQSIYRFRGASPDNIIAFPIQFEGARTLALAVNYRSREPIVKAFADFGTQMSASGSTQCDWYANKGEGEPLAFHIGNSLESEALGLAKAMKQMRKEGFAYRDQAVLCRSHTQLARYAAILESEGIPVLYLGDIFERDEVRDLLAMLSLVGEFTSSGLVRLSEFTDYTFDLEDLRVLIDSQIVSANSAFEALGEADGSALSESGRQSVERLRNDLGGIDRHKSAARALEEFLFVRSRWLMPLLVDGTVQGAQKRLAIYQLLQAAYTFAAAEPGAGIGRFLDWVRRLELLGEERQLRAPPAEAAGIDAVRLMTVHASKGLEFRAVYLPGLARGQFPASRRYDPSPPPPGLAERTPDEVRLEEEECLFFVALSRAQERLILSRATHYGTARGPSDFLAMISGRLPCAPDSAPDWITGSDENELPQYTAGCERKLESHRAEDLDQYLLCPRAYLYQRVLGLSGGREDEGYVRFHRAAYSVIRELGTFAEEPSPLAAARQALAEGWEKIGPKGHPFEAIYRRQAELVIERAIAHWLKAGSRPEPFEQPVGDSMVRLTPDMIDRSKGTVELIRLRTGRAPKRPPDNDIFALYHRASAAHDGGRVSVHYLGCDTRLGVPMSERVITNRLEKYRKAIDGVAAGHYPPQPDDRICPRCPQYFVCPSL